MKKIKEIGSVFWLSNKQISMKLIDVDCRINYLIETEEEVLTSSGRGAIKHLLNNLDKAKVALLPSFTCDSVLMPFYDCGYVVHFYRIKKNLTIDILDLFDKIKRFSPRIVFLQDYFGFDTLSTIRPYIDSFKSKGIIIVKDFTHSWLSDFNIDIADYYVASLHKWFEIPDGGVLLSTKHYVHQLKSAKEQTELVSSFIKLFKLKNKYFSSGNEKIKSEYRPILSEIVDIFDQDKGVYAISNLSRNLINSTDFYVIKKKRRNNYLQLHNGFKKVEILSPVFNNLEDGVTPLYYPVYVNGNREEIQGMLADRDIYCPIIWPIPEKIANYFDDDSLSAFNDILSIPCDQRYDNSDMDRIISCFIKY